MKNRSATQEARHASATIKARAHHARRRTDSDTATPARRTPAAPQAKAGKVKPDAIRNVQRKTVEALQDGTVTREKGRAGVEGLLDAQGKLVPELDPDSAWALLSSGAVAGGMRPKLVACLEAVKAGVGGEVLCNVW